ncbi:IS21 family transposase [Nevskia soli]|uniref:IS21 family transposase n=1 Tax=Nevskia soli TaxID=418856 RepID=UPI0004A6F527
MRKIREILRLTAAGLSARQIAASVGVARSTVADCLRRAVQAGVVWPLPAGLDEVELEARLYPPPSVREDAVPVPDWAKLQTELQRKGVTLLLLWQEYKAAVPAGYQYSRFCDLYRAWSQTQDLVLRQTHAPGDKCFVDYAGQTAEVIDPKTGEIRPAQVFVAVLGHSSYTYAEATWTQSAADWCGSHVRALDFFGGAPAAWVPDNLKAGVVKPDRYDPDLNPAYRDLAEHYGVTILPARVRKPRDKAKVEVGVQVVERWILARLRHHTFFSLAALNQAIAVLVAELNQKSFQKRDGSRASVFAAADAPALRPLPPDTYEYAAWKKAKVHLDYHVEVERRYYSVPHALVGKTVTVRLTAQAVEIYHRGQRAAAHLRSPLPGTFTTLAAHRPQRHQAIVDLSHEKLLRQAEAIGPATAGVLYAQIHARRHPEHALRASLGILRLARDFSSEKLEAACARALALKSTSYRAIRALIQAPTAQTELTLSLPEHENLRGSSYYH